MRDLGIYFGTFAPCHVGHFEQIIRAKRENEHALVIVSGYQGDRGDDYGMNLDHRTKAMRQLLRNDENVTVMKLDETDIPRYPAGWQSWMKMLASHIEEAIHSLPHSVKEITYYVGEEEYISPLLDYFKNSWPDMDTDVILVDRQILQISGTNIRKDALLNWDYVARPFRRFFVQNVLVAGAPKSGKSALVKDLARRYSTSHSVEYRKEYYETNQIEADEMDAKDLHAIGIGQFDLNRRNIHSPATRKVFFADTDVMTIKILTKMYDQTEDFTRLKAVFDYYIGLQNWALILLTPPGAHSSDAEAAVYRSLKDEIESQGLNDVTHELRGSSYSDVYQEAYSLVGDLLKDSKDS